MSVFVSSEHRAFEFGLINAYAALKEHSDLPTIDKVAEPNPKKRKLMQFERGVKTRKLRAEASSAHAAWKTWKLAHEPQNRCACGHDFKTHTSHQDNTKSVCWACWIREPAFQEAFSAKLMQKCTESTKPL
jgi:hypothetical protein